MKTRTPIRLSLRRLTLALAALALLPYFAYDVLAHGHSYRGPAGQVPPTGRTPQDPTPPPGGNGGGTGSGGNTGNTGGTGTIGGGGPVVGPRVGAGGSSGAGRASGSTTPTNGRRSKTTKSAGFERWEFWWAYNRERFLNLRDRLDDSGVPTGTVDWLLGNNKRANSIESERPTPRAIRTHVVPALVERLDDRFFDVRAAAVIALGKAGDGSTLPQLIDTLSDTHKQVSESAALAIGLLRETTGVPVLLELLHDTTKGRMLVKRPQGVPFRTRAFAAVGLGMIRDTKTIPDLVRYLDPKNAASNADVAVCAAIGLGLFQQDARDAVPSIVEAVQDARSHELVRAHAVTALGKIGDASTTPLLRRLLRDDSRHVNRSALLALGLVGDSTDKATVKLLETEAVKGADPQARNWALISLGKLGGNEAEKTLKRAIVDGIGTEKAFGALGLAILASNAGKMEAAGKYLRDGLARTKDPSTRGAFCIALGILGDRNSTDSLRKIVASRATAQLRGYAAVALGMMSATEATPALQSLMAKSTREPELQRAAAISLGLMGDRSAVSRLTQTLETSNTEYVQSSAATALGFIGDRTAVDALTRIAADTEKSADMARATATVALGVIGEDAAFPLLREVSENSNYRALVESLGELLTIN